RNPAGLFLISRSTPIRPPHTIARSAFGTKSPARGSIEPRDSTTLVTVCRPPSPRRYNYILFQGDAMHRESPEEGSATPRGTIRGGRGSRGGRRVVSAVACVAAAVFVGAALPRVPSQAQAVPTLAEAGARPNGGSLAQAPQDGFSAVAKAVMPAVV